MALALAQFDSDGKERNQWLIQSFIIKLMKLGVGRDPSDAEMGAIASSRAPQRCHVMSCHVATVMLMLLDIGIHRDPPSSINQMRNPPLMANYRRYLCQRSEIPYPVT